MHADGARRLRELGATVLERGWLSSNNIVLRPSDGGPATVVDTGYVVHEAQTLALVGSVAGPAGVARVVNTHLHSDHCGGNAALQAHWSCGTWVPEVSVDAVRHWDEDRLTYQQTDQRCRRFTAERGMAVGETLDLAGHAWQVLAAPGHDPDAVMLWQPDARVLISGDALWEARLAIIFPELEGRSGFDEANQVLDTIERLDPAVVIPGHGGPFSDVATALAASRARLAQFAADPRRHLNHAARALAMFHMLEVRSKPRAGLIGWLTGTPIFVSLLQRLGHGDAERAAAEVVQSLVVGGALLEPVENELRVPD